MNYSLQNFAGIPLCMDRLAVEARMSAPRQRQEPASGWLEDFLTERLKHLAVSYDPDSGIAEFMIQGVMWKGASMLEEYCYDLYNTDRIAANMREIAAKRGVSQVVVTIDTPGGMARGTREAAQSVLQYRQRSGVPVAAYIPNIGASAGYYVAAACSEIAAHPAALVGSIGTMAVAVDTSRLFKQAGFDLELYTGGADLKGMGSTGIEWTQAWHEKLKASVNELRGEFVSFVTANRPGIGEDSFRGDAFEARKAPPGMVDFVTDI